MSVKNLLRITLFLVLFFLLGHTVGLITRKNVTAPESKQIISLMEQTKIEMQGVDKTYDQFYEGMSANLSITLLSLAILLWMLIRLENNNRVVVKQLLIPVILLLSLFTVTGFIYFFLVPAITCLMASITSIFAYYKLSRSR